jgi:hypothetical protein
MRHIESGSELGQSFLYVFGIVPVAFGGRPDSERAQQLRRGLAGIARLAEDRVQPLAGQMVKH